MTQLSALRLVQPRSELDLDRTPAAPSVQHCQAFRLPPASGLPPALIDTANVIDNTMSALSFIGVDYDPDEPLDEALREVEAQLEGLPETISDQGARIGALVDDIRLTGTETGLISGRLDAIDAGLADAATTIDDYRQAIDDLGLVGDVGTDIAAAIPAARVALLVLALSGVALAIIGWKVAGRFEAVEPGV